MHICSSSRNRETALLTCNKATAINTSLEFWRISSNPFPDSGRIWHYGYRNPFNPKTNNPLIQRQNQNLRKPLKTSILSWKWKWEVRNVLTGVVQRSNKEIMEINKKLNTEFVRPNFKISREKKHIPCDINTLENVIDYGIPWKRFDY